MTFFAREIRDDFAVLSDEDLHHARDVMRCRDGDAIDVIFSGTKYRASFSSDNNNKILWALPMTEPTVKITLYQGIPKGDKAEHVVQCCTQAGACAFVPVAMKRCVALWKDGKAKSERLSKIAREAAKQSGRGIAPEVLPPVSIKELPEIIKKHSLAILPYERAGEAGGMSLKKLWDERAAEDVCLIIGPEGGLEAEEVEALMAAGAVPVTLGPRIFRTEEAGFAAINVIMALSGNME